MRGPLAVDSREENEIDPRTLKISGSIDGIWWLYLLVVPFDVITIVLLSLFGFAFLLLTSPLTAISIILLIYFFRHVMRDSKSVDTILIIILSLTLVVFLVQPIDFILAGSIFGGINILLLDILFIFLFVYVINGNKTILLINILPILRILWIFKEYIFLAYFLGILLGIIYIIEIVANLGNTDFLISLLIKIVAVMLLTRLFTFSKPGDKGNLAFTC